MWLSYLSLWLGIVRMTQNNKAHHFLKTVLDGKSDLSNRLRDFLPQTRISRALITTRSAQIRNDIASNDAIEKEKQEN
jgi:hypothetical protein